MTTPTTAPTQVTHSTRAALRTALQAFIPGLIAALAVLPPLIQSVLGDASVPGWLRGWLTIAAAGIAVVAGIVAKIMNVPQVNAWLTSIGIGARPASAASAPSMPPVIGGTAAAPPAAPPRPGLIPPTAPGARPAPTAVAPGDLSTLDKLDGLGKPADPPPAP